MTLAVVLVLVALILVAISALWPGHPVGPSGWNPHLFRLGVAFALAAWLVRLIG